MNELDDVSDLDEVFGPLRSSATTAEFSQEPVMVDRMANARRTAEGKHMFTSRRARVATLVAAGVLGFGGMAAASPSLLGDQPETEPVVQVEPVVAETIEPIAEVEPVEPEPVAEVEPEPEPVVEVEPEPEPVPEGEPAVPAESAEVEPSAVAPDDVLPVDDPATEFDETECLPGNHGSTVSAVARGEFPGDASVTEAAHSSCGKTVDIDVDDPEVAPGPEIAPGFELDTEPAPDRRERDTGAASNGTANENSNGKSNGNSNGKANGSSNGKGNGSSNGKGASGTRGG